MERGKNRHRISRLRDSMKKLVKSAGRGSRRGIVHQVIRDKNMRMKAATKLGIVLRKELISTCSPSSNSLFHDQNIDSLQNFTWADICKDLRRTAPHLSMILEKCAEANRSATCPSNANIVVSVVAGILLRNCSQRVNWLQRLFSVLLYSSHATKK